MAKKRTSIPNKAAGDVLYDADRRCCVCKRRGHQIHHLNEDPSDHRVENLVLLCFDCHEEASTKGGQARRLSREVLVRYREAWLAKVRLGRETRSAPRKATSTRRAAMTRQGTGAGGRRDATFDTMLDAVMVHEVRRVGYELKRLGPEWKKVVELVTALDGYASEKSPLVRGEVIDSVTEAVVRIGDGIPRDAAWAIAGVAANALPVWRMGRVRRHVVDPADRNILLAGSRLGLALAYDTMKQREAATDLRVVDAGAELFWEVLHHACKIGLADVRKHVLEDIGTVIALAEDVGYPEAARWLAFRRDDAISYGTSRTTTPAPADLMAKVWRR